MAMTGLRGMVSRPLSLGRWMRAIPGLDVIDTTPRIVLAVRIMSDRFAAGQSRAVVVADVCEDLVDSRYEEHKYRDQHDRPQETGDGPISRGHLEQ